MLSTVALVLYVAQILIGAAQRVARGCSHGRCRPTSRFPCLIWATLVALATVAPPVSRTDAVPPHRPSPSADAAEAPVANARGSLNATITAYYPADEAADHRPAA